MCDNSSPLPVAPRRSPRHPAVRLHASTSPSQRRPRQHAVSKASTTPGKTKRTRLSQPDSILASDVQVGPMTPPTTGRQRSVQRAIPTIKRRKYGKTARPTETKSTIRNHRFESPVMKPGCNEVRIFPLRAILDDRVKRRIRRNGLSEEMNTIYDERKQRAKNNIEEVQRLREELAAKEVENDLLREQSSLLQDTSRIKELEKEISDLRQGLRSENFSHVINDDWDMAAGDGFTDADSFSDLDDRFRDDTTLEVESPETVSLEEGKPYIEILKNFTPPNTSPTKSTSSDTSRRYCPPSFSDMGVQANFGDADQASLRNEVAQLRHELGSLQTALETKNHSEGLPRTNVVSMQDTKAIDGMDLDLQLQTDIMLQTLAEKTAALTDLKKLISTLGSPTSDTTDVVSNLARAFQSARQELEQIFPDEKPLDLSVEGAVILEQLLQRLRDSAVQATKYQALLEDSCIREQQLRDQLIDRVDAMDGMSCRLREKDDRIFRLEADMERSEAVVDDLRRSLAESLRAVEQSNAELTEIQVNLGSMVSVAADLQAQLAQVQVERDVEITARRTAYDEELTRRDTKLLELQKEVTALKEALTLAHESTTRLQEENQRLQGCVDGEKKIARDTVAALRTQLLQSLQTSEAFLAS